MLGLTQHHILFVVSLLILQLLFFNVLWKGKYSLNTTYFLWLKSNKHVMCSWEPKHNINARINTSLYKRRSVHYFNFLSFSSFMTKRSKHVRCSWEPKDNTNARIKVFFLKLQFWFLNVLWKGKYIIKYYLLFMTKK